MAASGMLSDSFGRKRVFLCCFVLFVVATLLGTLASTWQLLFVSRFVVGGLLMATTNLKFVWAMEMTDGKHNVIMNLANMWHFGYMAAAVIGYLTKHWKLYLIALCCVGFPLMFVYTIFFESPRWLIQKGHLDKAAANLSRIGRRNRGAGAEVTSAHLRDIPREEQRRPTSYLTLFSTRKLTAYTLVMCSLVFATGASVNAYILQVSQLAGDPFIKFFLYGFLRLYIPPLLYMTNKWDWFGRRHMVLVP
uniref:Major facilitator superfamily (MFS) profile domain-containing protein n=1 Tax=Plectus sambesii TaxID=2011161 RepID=A0A914VIT8_9BILA